MILDYTQKELLLLGNAVIKEVKKRFDISSDLPADFTLKQMLKSKKTGLWGLLDHDNPFYRQQKREDVFGLLILKKAISEDGSFFKIERNYFAAQEKLKTFEESTKFANPKLFNLSAFMVKCPEFFCIDDSREEEVLLPANKERKEMISKKLGIDPEKIEDMCYKASAIMISLDELNNEINKLHKLFNEKKAEHLTAIRRFYKNGRLKNALLNDCTVKVSIKKTTISQAIAKGAVYDPNEMDNGTVDREIVSLKDLSPKQILSLFFLAHKAKHQTKEEEEVVEYWKKETKDSNPDYRFVAFKNAECIESLHGQSLTVSQLSGGDRAREMDALESIKDIRIRVKLSSNVRKRSIHTDMPIVRRITDGEHPVYLTEEDRKAKIQKRFHIVAIPLALFLYKEKEKGKPLLDMSNFDRYIFSTLKYSDPEKKRLDIGLFKLFLILALECDYKNTHIKRKESTLMERIGLSTPNNKNPERQRKLLYEYIEKLKNHETIQDYDSKDGLITFKLREPKEIEKKQTPIK